MDKCFACNRVIKRIPIKADTRDEQIVYVGPECHRKIIKAGEMGYQPPLGGPKLYPVKKSMAEPEHKLVEGRVGRGKSDAPSLRTSPL